MWALKYKKPVIPLRVDADAELPFRLESRQDIDFSDGFDVGLARLRTYLDSVGSPKWVLQELRNQLAEAERELPRSDPEQRPRVRQDIEELRKRVGEQERLVADPRGRGPADRGADRGRAGAAAAAGAAGGGAGAGAVREPAAGGRAGLFPGPARRDRS